MLLVLAKSLRCRAVPGLFLVLQLGLCWLAPPAQGATSRVSVPIYLDYPLLQQLLLRQLFQTADGSRDILREAGGCSRIILSNPRISPREGSLEIIAAVNAQLGVSAVGSCQTLLNWQGTIGFLGKPVIQPGGKSVRLAPEETWLIDSQGSKISSAPLLEAGNQSLADFFAGFVLDFTPYLDSLAAFLPEILPHRSARQLQAIVDSLTLREITVSQEHLAASIDFEVEALPVAQVEQAAPALTDAELAQLESQWQMMDALLVGAVKHYAGATSLQTLRSSLLDILIDSRYRLRDALTAQGSGSSDAVRHWFIETWQRLSPTIRQLALEQEGQQYLLLFSVLSATDALEALDQLGPAIGLDISINGLRHLARLINAGAAEDMLRYSEDVDPELQRLLQEEIEADDPDLSVLRFNFSLFPNAHAASSTDDPGAWLADKEELGVYLPKIATLLEQSAGNVLKKHKLAPSYRELYQQLVLATAWQESCWRQYVVVNKRAEPLRSGTGDVGLMQINERVWRGFYDIHKLRWDISYNSNAGSEILFNYMTRYALKKGEQKQRGGLSNLARASYSAYNGGPSQVARYRRSGVAATHRKVDELFWAKYQQVAAGNAMNVANCLGGAPPAQTRSQTKAKPAPVKSTQPQTAPPKPPPARPAPAEPVPAKPAPAKPVLQAPTTATNPGSQWLLLQPTRNFTLQLGAFSTAAAASDFIRQQALPEPIFIYPLRKAQGTQYLILHGSYPQRSGADPVKQTYSKLQPWLRQFSDLLDAAGK
jgi:septal ring-binding cell division protein DamX